MPIFYLPLCAYSIYDQKVLFPFCFIFCFYSIQFNSVDLYSSFILTVHVASKQLHRNIETKGKIKLTKLSNYISLTSSHIPNVMDLKLREIKEVQNE